MTPGGARLLTLTEEAALAAEILGRPKPLDLGNLHRVRRDDPRHPVHTHGQRVGPSVGIPEALAQSYWMHRRYALGGGWTETAIRPDGRLYRARAKPSAQPYGEGGSGLWGVIVLRTHDVDVAVALAYVEWRRWIASGDPLPSPVRGWTRLVPWDAGGGGDWSWDSCTGREKGSMPCVWFEGQ